MNRENSETTDVKKYFIEIYRDLCLDVGRFEYGCIFHDYDNFGASRRLIALIYDKERGAYEASRVLYPENVPDQNEDPERAYTERNSTLKRIRYPKDGAMHIDYELEYVVNNERKLMLINIGEDEWG